MVVTQGNAAQTGTGPHRDRHCDQQRRAPEPLGKKGTVLAAPRRCTARRPGGGKRERGAARRCCGPSARRRCTPFPRGPFAACGRSSVERDGVRVVRCAAGTGGGTRRVLGLGVVSGRSQATAGRGSAGAPGPDPGPPAMTPARSSGSPSRSCCPRRTRSMIAIDGPRPNGAAEARVGDRGGPRVDVGGRGGVVAVQDLGCEVAGGPEEPAGVGQLGVVGHPGQPEVDQDRVAPLHQDVGGLDVAVQDADGVHRGGSPRPARGRASAGRRPRSGPPRPRGRAARGPGT